MAFSLKLLGKYQLVYFWGMKFGLNDPGLLSVIAVREDNLVFAKKKRNNKIKVNISDIH